MTAKAGKTKTGKTKTRKNAGTRRPSTIAITGTSRYWGERLAKRLLRNGSQAKLIGLDTARPAVRRKGLKTYTVDFKDPELVDLLKREKVRTAVHLHFVPRTRRSEAAFQDNVLGTMNFFAACAKAGVRKIIVKSSARVYGARSDNPLYLREDRFLRADPVFQYTRDLLDIELFANGFRRRHPRITFTTLRFAGIIGPTAKTPWTLYLRDAVVPTLLGFDPLCQVIHEEDVLDLICHVIDHTSRGSYNAAADGAFYLSQAIRLAGRRPAPVLTPFTTPIFKAARNARLIRFAPFELSYLKYPWIVDTSRMVEEMGFTPRYSGREALQSLKRAQTAFDPEAAN